MFKEALWNVCVVLEDACFVMLVVSISKLTRLSLSVCRAERDDKHHQKKGDE